MQGATPLFIDTGALYAQFDENAPRHERAREVFEAIGTGDLSYRPIYTSTYVLNELATLILSHRNHDATTTALERVLQSSTTVIHPDAADFDTTYTQLCRYDDHSISFTDHMSGILARERDIEHMFTFDDYFRTLGFTAVPDDTGSTNGH